MPKSNTPKNGGKVTRLKKPLRRRINTPAGEIVVTFDATGLTIRRPNKRTKLALAWEPLIQYALYHAGLVTSVQKILPGFDGVLAQESIDKLDRLATLLRKKAKPRTDAKRK